MRVYGNSVGGDRAQHSCNVLEVPRNILWLTDLTPVAQLSAALTVVKKKRVEERQATQRITGNHPHRAREYV
jgi:hypothetical protein